MTSRELSAAQTTERETREAEIQLAGQADRQELMLKRLLGLPTKADLELRGDIALPSEFHPSTAEALLDGLTERRLDLVALRRGYESQEAAVRAAILGQFPRVQIGPTVGRDAEAIETLGFSLSVELPIFDTNQGTIALERATRRQLFDEYAERVFAARSDVEMILLRVRYLNRQIAAAMATEPGLDQRVDDYHKAMAEGRVDSLSYQAVWMERAASQSKLLDLRGQLAHAVVALELAAGLYEVPQATAAAEPSTQNSHSGEHP